MKLQRRNRTLPLASTLAAAVLTAAIGWPLLQGLVEHHTRQGQFELLTEVSRTSAQIAHRARAQLLELANELDLPHQSGGCPLALRQQLQHALLQTSGIRALARVEDQTITCATTQTILGGLHLGPPSHVREDGLRTWHGVRLPDDPRGQRYLLIESRQLAILLLPTEQFALVGDEHIGLAVYEAREKPLTSFASGGIPDSWLVPTTVPGTSRSVDPATGALRVYHRGSEGQAMTLATVPGERVQALADARFAQLRWLLLFPALGAGLLVLMLWRLPFSTRRELEKALAGDGMFLLYQPVISLQGDCIIGAEALLRLRDNEGKVLTPDLFIPMIESLGMSTQLTDKVCQLLAEDLPPILRRHPDFIIGLNVSAQELGDMRLAQRMQQLQKQLKLPPGQLVVELTESSLVEAERALEVIASMRSSGIQIAIDDFGTGYCSLSYLSSIPFDILKIDHSFVTAAGTDAVIGPIADHVVTLSKAMGVDCLAEGIETAEQSAHFQQLGVKYAQGYFHGRPMHIHDLAATMRKSGN